MISFSCELLAAPAAPHLVTCGPKGPAQSCQRFWPAGAEFLTHAAGNLLLMTNAQWAEIGQVSLDFVQLVKGSHKK